jgi:hypothetical protein
MTLNDLYSVLAEVPPARLIALDLLNCPDAPHRDTLKKAVLELVNYTEVCQQTAERLTALAPIALTTLDVWEFGL